MGTGPSERNWLSLPAFTFVSISDYRNRIVLDLFIKCEYLRCGVTGFTFTDIVILLRTGRSAVRFPIGQRDISRLHNVQTDSWAHPASYLMSTGVLSWP